MSASRHCYAVAMKTNLVEGFTGERTSLAAAVIFDGSTANGMAVYGSKKDAKAHADHLNSLYPAKLGTDPNYTVIQLR